MTPGDPPPCVCSPYERRKHRPTSSYIDKHATDTTCMKYLKLPQLRCHERSKGLGLLVAGEPGWRDTTSSLVFPEISGDNVFGELNHMQNPRSEAPRGQLRLTSTSSWSRRSCSEELCLALTLFLICFLRFSQTTSELDRKIEINPYGIIT